MAKVPKWGWLGPEHIEINNKGIIDSAARKAFMHGQCHSLAMAIRKFTGWPLFGFVDFEDGDTKTSPGHVAVWVPELETHVDIGGRNALERWREKYPNAEPYRIYPSIIKRGMRAFLPLNISASLPYAKTILKKYCGRDIK